MLILTSLNDGQVTALLHAMTEYSCDHDACVSHEHDGSQNSASENRH